MRQKYILYLKIAFHIKEQPTWKTMSIQSNYNKYHVWYTTVILYEGRVKIIERSVASINAISEYLSFWKNTLRGKNDK